MYVGTLDNIFFKTILLFFFQKKSETIAACSGGRTVKSCRDEASAFAAQMSMMKRCERLKFLGVHHVNVHIRSRGGYYITSMPPCISAALKVMAKQLKLARLTFMDSTRIAHGKGCRIAGGRRGRRN